MCCRMDFGNWTEDRKGSYNNWDAISRSTIEVDSHLQSQSASFVHTILLFTLFLFWCLLQVYPGAWTAVLMSLDNAGVWNIRVENLDRWYLGQETYIRIINPEENGKTEMGQPKNVLYCGALRSLQKWALDTSLISTSSHISFRWWCVKILRHFSFVTLCRQQVHSSASSMLIGNLILIFSFMMVLLASPCWVSFWSSTG